MSQNGPHVSAAVYRARRRLLAAVVVTVLVLSVSTLHRLVRAAGSDEVSASSRTAVVAGAPLVTSTTGASTATPSATATPRATATTAARPTTATKPTAGGASPVTRSPVPAARPDDPVLPPSGSGRRVVYSIAHQRVWLVGGDGRVVRTYRVSGARKEYVAPGTFHVYSASTKAIAWDHRSTMRWMVRFARGPQTNIGFHEIPVQDDTHEPAQTISQLGIPLSDGCIRQSTGDARALFEFAPVGTEVVVSA